MSVDTDPIIDGFLRTALTDDVKMHPVVNRTVESVNYSRRTVELCYYITGVDVTASVNFPDTGHIVLLDMVENLAEGLYHYDENQFIDSLKWVLKHYSAFNKGSLDRLETVLSVLRMEKEL